MGKNILPHNFFWGGGGQTKIFSGQIWSNDGLTICIKKNLKIKIFCAKFTELLKFAYCFQFNRYRVVSDSS